MDALLQLLKCRMWYFDRISGKSDVPQIVKQLFLLLAALGLAVFGFVCIDVWNFVFQEKPDAEVFIAVLFLTLWASVFLRLPAIDMSNAFFLRDYLVFPVSRKTTATLEVGLSCFTIANLLIAVFYVASALRIVIEYHEVAVFSVLIYWIALLLLAVYVSDLVHFITFNHLMPTLAVTSILLVTLLFNMKRTVQVLGSGMTKLVNCVIGGDYTCFVVLFGAVSVVVILRYLMAKHVLYADYNLLV